MANTGTCRLCHGPVSGGGDIHGGAAIAGGLRTGCARTKPKANNRTARRRRRKHKTAKIGDLASKTGAPVEGTGRPRGAET